MTQQRKEALDNLVRLLAEEAIEEHIAGSVPLRQPAELPPMPAPAGYPVQRRILQRRPVKAARG